MKRDRANLRVWCPFEGQEQDAIVIRIGTERRFRVNCCGCDALGPSAPTEVGALRRWRRGVKVR